MNGYNLELDNIKFPSGIPRRQCYRIGLAGIFTALLTILFCNVHGAGCQQVPVGTDIVQNGNFSSSGQGWEISIDCFLIETLYPSLGPFATPNQFSITNIDTPAYQGNLLTSFWKAGGAPVAPTTDLYPTFQFSCYTYQQVSTDIGSVYQFQVEYQFYSYQVSNGTSFAFNGTVVGFFQIDGKLCPLISNSYAQVCTLSITATTNTSVIYGPIFRGWWNSPVTIVAQPKLTITKVSMIKTQDLFNSSCGVNGSYPLQNSTLVPIGTNLVQNPTYSNQGENWLLSTDCAYLSSTYPYPNDLWTNGFYYNSTDAPNYGVSCSISYWKHISFNAPSTDPCWTFPWQCYTTQTVDTEIGAKYLLEVQYYFRTYTYSPADSYDFNGTVVGYFEVDGSKCILYSYKDIQTCTLNFTATSIQATLLGPVFMGFQNSPHATILSPGINIQRVLFTKISDPPYCSPPLTEEETTLIPLGTNLVSNPNFASQGSDWDVSIDCGFANLTWSIANLWRNGSWIDSVLDAPTFSAAVSPLGSLWNYSDSAVRPLTNIYPTFPMLCYLSQDISTEVGAMYQLEITYIFAPIEVTGFGWQFAGVGTNVGLFQIDGAQCVLLSGFNLQTCVVNFTATQSSTVLVGPIFQGAKNLPYGSTQGPLFNISSISIIKIADPPTCSLSSENPLLPMFKHCPSPPVASPPASCQQDQYCVIYGSINETLTVIGPTNIVGNVSNSHTNINGLFPLNVTGCYDSATTTITLSNQDLQNIVQSKKGGSYTIQNLIVQDPNCPPILASSIEIQSYNLGCKKITAKPVSNGDTINVVFNVDTFGCDIWWIILASVLGGLALFILIFIIIYINSPKFRAKINPFSARTANAAN